MIIPHLILRTCGTMAMWVPDRGEVCRVALGGAWLQRTGSGPRLVDPARCPNSNAPVIQCARGHNSTGTIMTKKIRIENADMANYRVMVQVWDKGADGAPDTMAFERLLGYPTAMTGDEVYLTSTRYIVVKELPALPAS